MSSQTETTLSNVSLEERAYRICRYALRMGEVQGQGYIAQALGLADVLAAIYFHATDYRADDPEWEAREKNHFLRVEPNEWAEAINILDEGRTR